VIRPIISNFSTVRFFENLSAYSIRRLSIFLIVSQKILQAAYSDFQILKEAAIATRIKNVPLCLWRIFFLIGHFLFSERTVFHDHLGFGALAKKSLM